MYQALLKEHLEDKKSTGEQPQPPATPAQLQALRARAKKELGVDLPPEYYRFLETTNGLDSNGVVIYATEATTLVGYPDRPLDGLVEANQVWWEREANRRYVFFGDAGISLYAYDREDRKYKVLDRQSGEVVEEFETFEELVHRALEAHRP